MASRWSIQIDLATLSGEADAEGTKDHHDQKIARDVSEPDHRGEAGVTKSAVTRNASAGEWSRCGRQTDLGRRCMSRLCRNLRPHPFHQPTSRPRRRASRQ
jgi:hypothetical protein